MAKPQIRLKGFNEEWDKNGFEDSFSFLKNISFSRAELDSNIGSVRNVHYGDVLIKFGELLDVSLDQLPFVKDESLLRSLRKEHLIENGDVIFADAAEDSSVGKCSELIGKVENEVITSGLHTIPCRPVGTFKPGFWGYYLNSCQFHNQLLPLIQGSKVSGISKKALCSTVVSYPSPTEQEEIVAYFRSLDALIQAAAKKIDSLKQMKAACLQSMFPQPGETAPKVRFKGFTDDWEDVSFKDITFLAGVRNKENLSLESYSISNEKGFVPQNEQFEKGGTMTSADKTLYYIVSADTFAYNPARINVGSIGYYEFGPDIIVSSLYVVFKTDENTYNPFLNYWFKTPVFRKLVNFFQEGGVRFYFFYDKLCSCRMRRPSLEEQQQIASFFSELDSQIRLHEQRLGKLKQIKASCLDKMFV